MAFFRRAELWACLSALGFAGCVINGDDGETEASTSGPSTMSTTATPTGGDDDGGTAGTTMASADDTAGDTAADTAADTAGDTAADTAGDTGTPADPTEACLAACETAAECRKFDPADCPTDCREDVGFAEDDGCVSEATAWWQCISMLDCGQYAEWQAGAVGEKYPCSVEDEALFSCEPAGDTGGSDTGGDSSTGA
jgi:hypothetical protein